MLGLRTDFRIHILSTVLLNCMARLNGEALRPQVLMQCLLMHLLFFLLFILEIVIKGINGRVQWQ